MVHANSSDRSQEQARTSAITYRPVTWSDTDELVDLFNLIWPQLGFEKSILSLLMARYFTMHYLELTTDGIAAVLNDGTDEATIAGIALLRADTHALAFPEARESLRCTRRLLTADPKGHMLLQSAEQFLANEVVLERDCDIESSTQGELELFFVNPSVKGRGVGGELWKRINQTFADAGTSSFFLHTDTGCDYAFYEHKGFERVAERLHANHPEDDESFVMSKDDQFIYRGDVQLN